MHAKQQQAQIDEPKLLVNVQSSSVFVITKEQLDGGEAGCMAQDPFLGPGMMTLIKQTRFAIVLSRFHFLRVVAGGRYVEGSVEAHAIDLMLEL